MACGRNQSDAFSNLSVAIVLDESKSRVRDPRTDRVPGLAHCGHKLLSLDMNRNSWKFAESTNVVEVQMACDDGHDLFAGEGAFGQSDIQRPPLRLVQSVDLSIIPI